MNIVRRCERIMLWRELESSRNVQLFVCELASQIYFPEFDKLWFSRYSVSSFLPPSKARSTLCSVVNHTQPRRSTIARSNSEDPRAAPRERRRSVRNVNRRAISFLHWTHLRIGKVLREQGLIFSLSKLRFGQTIKDVLKKKNIYI